jgi:hypothetical protein
MVSSKTTGMSPEEMRARADLCKRMALSFGPTNSEMMREVADLWHRLAADADARAANPLRPLVSYELTRDNTCEESCGRGGGGVQPWAC